MSKSKFKEYYALNLRFISPVIFVLSLVMGIAGGLLTDRWISFRWFVIFIWAICVPDIYKVCSKTLYQKEAYFYQSFPVTPFQTVLAKTLVCAQLLQMGPFAFLAAGFIKTGRLYGLERGGLLAMLLGFIGLEAFCLLTSGIILQGFDFGNIFRDRKKGKPALAVSVITMGLQFGIVLMLLLKALEAPDNLFVVSLCSGGLVLFAVLSIWMNSVRLGKHYSV